MQSACISYIVTCDLPGLRYFSALSHKWYDVREKVIAHKRRIKEKTELLL